MTTSFAFLFFGALLVAAIVGMAKIQRQELLDARAVKQAARAVQQVREARIKEFRAKCCRPDED